MNSFGLSQTKSSGLGKSFHILIETIEFSVLIHNSSKEKKHICYLQAIFVPGYVSSKKVQSKIRNKRIRLSSL